VVQERKRKRKQRSTGSKRTENGEPATNPAGTRSVTCGGGPSWWSWWWTLNALAEYVPWVIAGESLTGGRDWPMQAMAPAGCVPVERTLTCQGPPGASAAVPSLRAWCHHGVDRRRLSGARSRRQLQMMEGPSPCPLAPLSSAVAAVPQVLVWVGAAPWYWTIVGALQVALLCPARMPLSRLDSRPPTDRLSNAGSHPAGPSGPSGRVATLLLSPRLSAPARQLEPDHARRRAAGGVGGPVRRRCDAAVCRRSPQHRGSWPGGGIDTMSQEARSAPLRAARPRHDWDGTEEEGETGGPRVHRRPHPSSTSPDCLPAAGRTTTRPSGGRWPWLAGGWQRLRRIPPVLTQRRAARVQQRPPPPPLLQIGLAATSGGRGAFTYYYRYVWWMMTSSSPPSRDDGAIARLHLATASAMGAGRYVMAAAPLAGQVM